MAMKPRGKFVMDGYRFYMAPDYEGRYSEGSAGDFKRGTAALDNAIFFNESPGHKPGYGIEGMQQLFKTTRERRDIARALAKREKMFEDAERTAEALKQAKRNEELKSANPRQRRSIRELWRIQDEAERAEIEKTRYLQRRANLERMRQGLDPNVRY